MTDTATANGKVDEQVTEKVRAALRVDALRENGWKLDLPDEQWAQLRDPKKIPEGVRNGFKSTGIGAELIGQRVDAAIAAGDYAAVAELVRRQAEEIVRIDRLNILMFVESWSFDLPLTPQAFDAVPGPAFDRLSLTAKELNDLAFVDLSPTRDADSPFFSSSG